MLITLIPASSACIRVCPHMALNGEAVLAIQSTSTCLVTGRRRFITSKEHPFLIIFRQGQHPSRHIRAIHHNHQPTQVPDFTSAAINHQGWVCGIDIEIDVPKPRILTASEIPELQVEVSCIQASLDIPIPTAAPGYVASPGATDEVDTI